MILIWTTSDRKTQALGLAPQKADSSTPRGSGPRSASPA